MVGYDFDVKSFAFRSCKRGGDNEEGRKLLRKIKLGKISRTSNLDEHRGLRKKVRADRKT